MSKENQPSKLRLLGSPVNLSYRDKKKDEKKNNRNRPRSAIQNSCFTPDYQERCRRPYSADANTRSSNKNNLLKAFSIEAIPCNPPPRQVKVVPPTTDILEYSKSLGSLPQTDKDLCSNASDYGSEDTFVSLGTKIKAKAQSNYKNKYQSHKNHLKYRNIAKKDKKINSDNNSFESKIENGSNSYDMEVKITEKEKDNLFDDPPYGYRTSSPYKNSTYDSYFVPFRENNETRKFSLLKNNTSDPLGTDVDALDFYSRQLKLNKQLSLVEEESTQDFSSLSPENSVENLANDTKKYNAGNEKNNLKEDYEKLSQNFFKDRSYDVRTYKSFYNDFQKHEIGANREKVLSSSNNHVDVSSKDSGYTDSGSNDEKPFKRTASLPNTIALLKEKYLSNNDAKSLSYCDKNDSYLNTGTYPPDKKKLEITEPINHSRLLYKEFFLRKEINGPNPPHNSPSKSLDKITVTNEIKNDNEDDTGDSNIEYPKYLLNSTTKAYTSKVIEDYKKEIAAINNLHELTIKDIKTDAISPTPLNIDKMFEENSGDLTHSSPDSQENGLSQSKLSEESKKSVGIYKEKDVTKISTKDLIDDYLKVKENGYYGEHFEPKLLRNYDYNLKNTDSLTNVSQKNINKPATNMSTKISAPLVKDLQFTNKNQLSARIDLVENDRDVDSWMSLTIPTPRINETDSFENQLNVNDDIKSSKGNDSDETSPSPQIETLSNDDAKSEKVKELDNNASVLDIYSMLKEIESYGENPIIVEKEETVQTNTSNSNVIEPKDNFTEIFEFLEKVEQSANEALSVVTNTTPLSIPKLENLLRLPQTELAQRLVTASLQLEERSCCIALLQESLTNHKQQMVAKISALEKQSVRNVTKVKHECEEAIKRHQNFIDQLINDKKTLNHRIEQLVDERRTLEERWKRQAQTLEDRYKLELKNQHDKMAAAQQVARQRWVRQKAEKIKELTVKGLEGELRDMADRQQKEISDLKMYHAEVLGKLQARHADDLEAMRRSLGDEKETALLKERQLASSRLEKQILELELTYQEQRTRLVAEMRAENERVASGLTEREHSTRMEIEKWKEEQEKLIDQKKTQLEQEMAQERALMEEEINNKKEQLQEEFENYMRKFEAEQNALFKKREKEISAQCKQERDREIEKAIESMEGEAQAGRKDMQDALKRNKEQYELELKELAETEQATLKRYQDTQARVRQTEDKCAGLEVTISQLETRNRLLTEKNTQLEQHANEIRSSCEETWRLKLDTLRKEMEDCRKTHEEQMHQLYAKVKIAVARKDSAIQALTRETSKGQEKITLLEQKLQQQRKDFLKHK